jgi:hypothetical protein
LYDDAQANSINFRGKHNEGNKLKRPYSPLELSQYRSHHRNSFTAFGWGTVPRVLYSAFWGETGNGGVLLLQLVIAFKVLEYVMRVYWSDEGNNEYGLSVLCVRN